MIKCLTNCIKISCTSRALVRKPKFHPQYVMEFCTDSKSLAKDKVQHKLPSDSDGTHRNKKLKFNVDSMGSKVKIETIPEKYNVTYLDTPDKSESDKKKYMVIKLKNGVTALLISDVEHMIDISLTNMAAQTYSGRERRKSSEGSASSDKSNPSVGKKGSDGKKDSESKKDGSETTTDDEADLDEDIDADADNKEKLAACALTVGVGSFSDPPEIPGLAHFLEHMLFMGSEKFPKENDFDAFIGNRGGTDNASTECEHTTFYFDCPEIHLQEALDRFSNFFVTPLMKRSSMTREREAVESEFKMNSVSDSLRLEQLFCSTAPFENPAHKFMWGNLITLQQNVTDDQLYAALREFWNKHYSADRMTVAIQGRLPLDILGEWVAKYFGEIKCNSVPPNSFGSVEQPFKMELFNKFYTVKPVKDVNKLQITWAFPPVVHLYKSRPLSYLSFLIGHEGEGSLLVYLQEKLWALSITAGNSEDGIESNSLYSLFSIEIVLTKRGLQNLKEVLHLIFGYVKLLQNRGPNESIFNEIKLLDEMNFRFQPEIDPSDYVETLSQNMQIYAPKDYITGDKLLYDYNPEEIIQFMSLMTPDRANIMLLSKIAAKKANLDKTEPWFKTKYNMKDIPEEWIDYWKTCDPTKYFSLPFTNPYIANNFHILPIPKELPEYPEKIVSDTYMEVWYKQDNVFKLPYGFVMISLISATAIATPKNAAMCDLFVALFKIVVGKETYPASLASLNYNLSAGDNGLNLSIQGFNDKLHLLLDNLLKKITSFHKNITPELFDALKEEQRKIYINKTIRPSKLCQEIRLSILCVLLWNSIDKLNVLPEITLEDIKAFGVSLFETLYVKCLIQGNISKKQAIKISKNIKDTINYNPIQGNYPRVQVRRVPLGENILRVQSFNIHDVNSIVTNYYQCGRNSIDESCKVELLMMMIQEPLFDTLRTKEQLGYDVGCQLRDTSGILGFSLSVKSQADKFSIDHVESRMSHFLKTMENHVKEIPTFDFEQIKDSLKILKQQTDTHLKEEVFRNWSEITSNEYIFDRNKQEFKYVETLQHKEVLEYFTNVLKHNKGGNEDSTSLRKLSVQVEGEDNDGSDTSHTSHKQKKEPKRETTVSEEEILFSGEVKYLVKIPKKDKTKFITDIEQFKSSLYIYPLKN